MNEIEQSIVQAFLQAGWTIGDLLAAARTDLPREMLEVHLGRARVVRGAREFTVLINTGTVFAALIYDLKQRMRFSRHVDEVIDQGLVYPVGEDTLARIKWVRVLPASQLKIEGRSYKDVFGGPSDGWISNAGYLHPSRFESLHIANSVQELRPGERIVIAHQHFEGIHGDDFVLAVGCDDRGRYVANCDLSSKPIPGDELVAVMDTRPR